MTKRSTVPPEVAARIRNARGRAHRWKTADPAAWQERHSPTEAVEVKIMTRVEVAGGQAQRVVMTGELCRRRTRDARLWRVIECADLERGAMGIHLGYRLRIEGVQARTISRMATEAEAAGSPLTPQDLAARLLDCERAYVAWINAGPAKGINVSAVLSMIVDGMSARATDRAYRRRKGWAMGNLVDGLLLYERQQGWKSWLNSCI